MVAYLASKTPAVLVTDELVRRYLAYVRFNASASTSRRHADNMATRLARWRGVRPKNNRDALYNTLQRLAVTQWHEAARVYR